MLTLGSLKMILEVIITIAAITGLIYKIAKLEQDIYFKIDNVDDYAKENIIKIDSQLELIDYKIDDLVTKFHQIDRALRENDIVVRVRRDDK